MPLTITTNIAYQWKALVVQLDCIYLHDLRSWLSSDSPDLNCPGEDSESRESAIFPSINPQLCQRTNPDVICIRILSEASTLPLFQDSSRSSLSPHKERAIPCRIDSKSSITKLEKEIRGISTRSVTEGNRRLEGLVWTEGISRDLSRLFWTLNLLFSLSLLMFFLQKIFSWTKMIFPLTPFHE